MTAKPQCILVSGVSKLKYHSVYIGKLSLAYIFANILGVSPVSMKQEGGGDDDTLLNDLSPAILFIFHNSLSLNKGGNDNTTVRSETQVFLSGLENYFNKNEKGNLSAFGG